MDLKWKKDEMISHLDEFYSLYLKRPIKENSGGMKSPHMFPAWFILKKLKPKNIIESGVWKGLGSWFFENASPNSKIISIDPNPQYRVYTSPKIKYRTEDFSTIDFGEIDKDDTLVFFDDHQDSLQRISQCLKFGFTKIMFEDNYPFDQGDCYSPKKIFSGKDYCIDNAGNRKYFTANKEHKIFLETNIEYYQEMFPIFKPEKTRWNTEWNYETPESLLTENEIKNKYPDFYKEIFDYTWICYLELKK